MRPLIVRRLLAALCAACTAFFAAGNTPLAQPPSAQPTSANAAAGQLWLVNTRLLRHAPTHSSRRIVPEVSRYEEGWRTAHYDDLSAPAPLTVVFVHGNDTDDAKCRARGLALYEALSAGAPAPLRMIVWSWPADYIPGTIRHDAQLKAERAEADAIYLARLLGALERGTHVVLVGYSLGARVVGGALHLLAGGTLDGQSIGSIVPDGPRLRGVLLAAAIDDDWLLPGHRYGRALAAVERLALFVNPRDRVLRWYRFLTPASGPALGVRGLAALGGLGAPRRKLEQINVNPLLGGQHGWSNYAASKEIIERLRQEVFAPSRAESWSAVIHHRFPLSRSDLCAARHAAVLSEGQNQRSLRDQAKRRGAPHASVRYKMVFMCRNHGRAEHWCTQSRPDRSAYTSRAPK